MKKVILLGVMLSFVITGCRLDSFLFNPRETDEYLFDAFDTPPEYLLDASYDIPQNLMHLMALTSGPADDQETIYALYIGDTTQISQDTVIIYCHGNAGNLDYYWQRAKLLANVGGKNRYGVMFMDYRGYGRSTGKATEAGMYYDVDACMQWLANHGLTNERTVMYGFSLGCAPTLELTANPRTLEPAKIITEAPFASFDYIAQDVGKISLPGSYFTNLEVDNAEEIKKVQVPFLWMHGVIDDFIGIDHGELVAQNYQGPKKIVRRVEGAGHGDVPWIMGLATYTQLLADFIEN